MSRLYEHVGLDEPAEYTIKVAGRVNADFANWLEDGFDCTFETNHPGNTVTCLTGIVADQAALHGLIGRIRDLGLVLLFVDCLSAHVVHGGAAERIEWRDDE